VEFRLLGSFEVLEGGRTLAVGGAKQRALLAILLLHANEPVSLDRIVDDLWGERPPATAAHTVRVYVSNLRKIVGADRLLTRVPAAYLARVDVDELDVERFTGLVTEASRARGSGDFDGAADRLSRALDLWRGSALADFVFEPFAQTAIARLEELRLAAIEERTDVELERGHHAELVGDLRALVSENPLRERLCGQLMLALYRSGRQAEALEVFKDARRALVEGLGIDPSPALQRLEKAILVQDPDLEYASTRGEVPSPPRAVRSILVAAADITLLDGAIAFAEPLALAPPAHALIVGLTLPPGGDLASATAGLTSRRARLADRGVSAFVAAFTSTDPTTDLVKLASERNVDLMLLDGWSAVADGGFTTEAATILADAPSDVALLFGRDGVADGAQPVLVPFGGGDHDWAALELGAWFAGAYGVTLRLLGRRADKDAELPDASRLLAHAALAVQQLAGVATEPILAEPGEAGVLEAASHASLLVVGLGESWRRDGLGSAREALAHDAAAPTLIVRRGPRPGGLAPGETLTRFTWSLSSSGYADVGSEALSNASA
jgi:DNA-binding SARP family transcriptional activator